ncbi:MAG: SIMPL domain-containing protein [Nitrososphaeria archaeon]
MNKEQAIAIFGALALTLALVSTSIYAIFLSHPTTATEVDEVKEHTIYVYGTGEIKVNPDMAKIMLSVITEEPNAKDAATKNALIVEELIKRLENIGVSKEDIQTTSYNIYPIYYYPKEGQPTIVGYRVVNSLEVRVTEKDVNKLGLNAGKIIDEAVAAGVNQVTGIIFTVTDESYKNLKSTALKLAVEDAVSKAKLIAETLGVKILGVKSVNEGSYSPTPVYVKEVSAQSGTTIIPGQVTIQYTVQVTYLIE